MKIEHIAIWTQNLERLKDFYMTYFEARANQKYINPANGFESYFLCFSSGARLELMYRPEIRSVQDFPENPVGFTHLAFSAGSRERVNQLTDELQAAGYTVVSAPRTTGDGYYESLILDPDGNRVEITV